MPSLKDTSDLKRLQIRLNLFIEEIRHLQSSISASSETQKQEAVETLLDKYKPLNHSFRNVKPKEIEAFFSKEELTAINFLRLGYKNSSVFRQLANILVSYPIDAPLIMAQYISSKEGFKDIRVTFAKAGLDEKELQGIFKSWLGIELAKDCVESFRAEKIGSFLAYCLSGLAEPRKKEFLEKNPDATDKQIAMFLIEDIRRHDVTFEFIKKDKDAVLSLSGWVDETRDRGTDGYRGARQADHCVCNHYVKKIVIGFSTFSDDLEDQKLSFSDGIEAIRLMVQQEYINGKPNPYYGYEVEPFYFGKGVFVGNTDSIEENKNERIPGQIVLRSAQNASSEELESLAQFSGMLSLANNVSKEEQLARFFECNMLLSGTKTLDIYNFSQSLKLTEDLKERTPLIRALLCKKATLSLRAINASLLSHERDDTEKNGRSFFERFGKGMTSFLYALPLLSSKPADQEFWNDFIVPLQKEAKIFVEKYKDKTQSEEKLIGNFEFGLDVISDGREVFNKKVARYNIHPYQPIWMDPPKGNIVAVDSPTATCDNLKPVVYMAEALAENGYYNFKDNDVFDEYLQERLRKLSQVLRYILIDKDPPEKATKKVFGNVPRSEISKFFAMLVDDLDGSNRSVAEDFVRTVQFITHNTFDLDALTPTRKKSVLGLVKEFQKPNYNRLKNHASKKQIEEKLMHEKEQRIDGVDNVVVKRKNAKKG